MTWIVEHPEETTFVEAIKKYDGYFVGLHITELDGRGDPVKVITLAYSDEPDEKFGDAMDELDINFILWANYDNLWLPDREIDVEEEV